MTDARGAAIVTGASRGIGAAIAMRLATDGYPVVINFAGNRAAADEVLKAVEERGGRGMLFQADVSDPAAVGRLFVAAGKEFGSVDVVVNNAGIMKLSPIAETDDALFDSHVAINLKGTFNVLREAARRVRSGGRIVSLSSSVVGLYFPGYAVYAATKAGVEAMTHVLVKELRGRNVTVNVIAPGPTGTALFLDGKPQSVIDELTHLAPLERLGRPEDIANAVSFLASADGSWVNGQVLRVNGGII
jgi:3-oxoacyl-[acyl-carrier protein] reductase